MQPDGCSQLPAALLGRASNLSIQRHFANSTCEDCRRSLLFIEHLALLV
jgi:hypothetical protein